MLRRTLISALLPALFAVVVIQPAVASAADTFSCRASAARVVTSAPLPALTVEPIVANTAGAPCTTDAHQVLSPTTIGPVTAAAVYAATDLAPGVHAKSVAGVANAAIAPSPTSGITAGVLEAAAAYECVNGQPHATSSSHVVNLVINGNPINVPDGPLTIDLGPLGTLYLNQTVTEPNRVTQRAFYLHTPLSDIVIGEAIADISGNPCTPAPAPAQGVLGEKRATAKAVLDTSPTSVRRTVLRYGTSRCIQHSFLAVVRGRNIRSVTFAMDGHTLKVDRSSRFDARIRGAAGIHTITARVTFTSATRAAPRTLRLKFRRCAAPVQFTG